METTRSAGTLMLLSFIILALIGLIAPAGAQVDPDLNDPTYWETVTEHPSRCFKHEAGEETVHGSITGDGLSVTLSPFNPDWWGDHWEYLVIKAGQVNREVDHPTAEVEYVVDQEVSHWIVCKGENGTTTTMSTTTTTESTTTTTRATTTTETTTPPSTTSTTDPTTTTTLSSTTSTTAPPSTSVPPTTLPLTGVEDVGLYVGWAIAALALIGLGILSVKRR